MLEGEVEPASASYLTFYRVDSEGQILDEKGASARDVATVVRLLEAGALSPTSNTVVDVANVTQVARSVAAQLENRTRVAGSIFGGGPTRHALPIPVALAMIVDADSD
jgi:hypothetical protein